MLAKEIIHSRKAVSRLYVNKAQMISIGNALTEQLGERSTPHILCLVDTHYCSSSSSSSSRGQHALQQLLYEQQRMFADKAPAAVSSATQPCFHQQLCCCLQRSVVRAECCSLAALANSSRQPPCLREHDWSCVHAALCSLHAPAVHCCCLLFFSAACCCVCVYVCAVQPCCVCLAASRSLVR